MSNKNEIYAAIAMALQGNNMHDTESYKITIKNRDTQWNGHALSMTIHP